MMKRIVMKKLLLFVMCMTISSLLLSCSDDEDDAFSPMKLPASTSDKVYTEDEVDGKPTFPGGENMYRKYLGIYTRYPTIAAEKGIQGEVVISFIVEKDGSLSDFQIEKSVHESLDNEALRVLRGMPAWIPGYYQNMRVRVRSHAPVRFILQ